MKGRFLVLLMALVGMANLKAQDLLVFGGLNNNRFCDYKRDNSQFSTFYSSLKGANFGIGLDNVKIAKHTFLFTLRASAYNGYVYTTARQADAVTTTGIELNKSIVGLGIYPFNFKILDNHLDFSFGVESNVLLKTNLKGYRNTVSTVDKPTISTIIDTSAKSMVNKFGMGLSGRLAYRLKIKNDLYLVPQYTFYCGLTNELKNIEANTKSYRHLIEIGLMKNIFSK